MAPPTTGPKIAEKNASTAARVCRAAVSYTHLDVYKRQEEFVELAKAQQEQEALKEAEME